MCPAALKWLLKEMIMAAIESNVQTRYYFIGKNSKLPLHVENCHAIVSQWNSQWLEQIDHFKRWTFLSGNFRVGLDCFIWFRNIFEGFGKMASNLKLQWSNTAKETPDKGFYLALTCLLTRGYGDMLAVAIEKKIKNSVWSAMTLFEALDADIGILVATFYHQNIEMRENCFSVSVLECICLPLMTLKYPRA